MKILHIITSLDTGGAEKMLYKLLSGMDKNRFESRVICLIPPGPVETQINSLGIPVKSLGLKRGKISPGGLISLLKMIHAWKPDIIQTWLYHADLIGYFAAKFFGIKNLIWNIRNTEMDLKKYSRVTTWTVKACGFFSNYPKVILANSDIAKENHINAYGYNKDKFQIILNGFDLSVFKPDEKAGKKIRKELNIDENSICIGLVGRYDPQKDHASFIKAAKKVCWKFPDIICILAGRDITWDNKEIKTLINENNFQENFRLLGERTDIPDIMNALDIYCSASAFGEGFPNVVGEAMACGCPCVVTDVGQSASVVGDTGVVVMPEQPDALAQGMIKLASLPTEERQRSGQKARKRVEENYSLPKIVQQYEDLYNRIAESS